MHSIRMFCMMTNSSQVQIHKRLTLLSLSPFPPHSFWWGGRPGPSGTRRLYQITHDYLCHNKNLTNLIWTWNIQDFVTLQSDADAYNPGNEVSMRCYIFRCTHPSTCICTSFSPPTSIFIFIIPIFFSVYPAITSTVLGSRYARRIRGLHQAKVRRHGRRRWQ
mmetsp:Transcript_24578/g.70851  ORF Transcript_24578/g.70851 Transcript_24578/m.70851 type:complete len:163 (-) Transcript_24578:858-1346(-)